MRMRYATIGETMDVREKVWEKRTFQNENHNESLKHTNTPRNEIEFDDTLRCEDDKHAVQCSGHKSYKQRRAREKEKVKTKFVMFIRVTKRSAEAEEKTLKQNKKQVEN